MSDSHDRARKGARILASDDEPTLVGTERYPELSQEGIVWVFDRPTEPEDAQTT